MFGWISSVASKIIGVFRTGEAQRAISLALDYSAYALPYVLMAGEIIASVTTTPLDDVVLVMLRAKFPTLFRTDPPLTRDELTSLAVGIAAELMRLRYPELTTTLARSAVQLCYTAGRAEGKL